MKETPRLRDFSIAAMLLLFAVNLQAAPVQSATPGPIDDPIAVKRANYTAWDSPDRAIGPNHRTTFRFNKNRESKIVELATGMNYWDGQEWLPSKAQFEADKDGYTAQKVQHPVHLAGDLYSRNAVTLSTPDGIELHSTPLAIALFDTVTGDFSVIASVTNCAPLLVGSNRVVYQDAFTGGVCANVVYTISESTFHQDVVLTGRLDPRDYGFDEKNTRIQIITEFYDAPSPDRMRRPIYIEKDKKKRATMAAPDEIDEQLGFGNLVLTTGKAFVASEMPDADQFETPVAKEYKTTEDGRTLLIESVPFGALSNALQTLPVCSEAIKSAARTRMQSYAVVPKIRNNRSARPVIIEASNYQVQGVVIDYVANIGGNMYGTTIFKGDTTYLISSGVYCNGPVIVEGGAVFKYKPFTSILLNSTLTCKTGSYRPAIFTCVDDDTVGETMDQIANSGYTGIISNNGYANPALNTPFDIDLINLRFRYAATAIQIAFKVNCTVSHSQFLNCLVGIDSLGIYSGCSSGCGGGGCGCGGEASIINLYNCLMHNVQVPFVSNMSCGDITSEFINIFNSTIDQSSTLLSSDAGCGSGISINAINSIFGNIENAFELSGYGLSFQTNGANNLFWNFGTSPYYDPFGSMRSFTSTSPFQSVGGGNYYLQRGYESLGTRYGLPPSLVADLSKRTTVPPSVLESTTLSSDQMLVPQPGLRDTDGLDFGYHYDPVDYAFHGVTIRNAKITVQPGTVIGTFAVSGINSSGLIVADGATFDSQGKPNDSNWIVSFDTISDNPTATWQPAENSVATSFSGIDLPPTIFCRFTSWSIIDQGSAHFNAATSAGNISFQDNEFHGGDFITSLPTISLKNCLFERVDATIASTDSGAPYIRNCLFFGGTFDFEPNVSTSVVKDNLFDQTIIPDNSATYASYDGGYNAYVTATSDHLQPEFPSTDKVLTAAPVYVAGPLGFYYQPVNNNSLLDADLSTTAASVGLYHYAVTATPVGGQSKEGNSSLDIGYHYVTVDANGNPLDANLDSIPDYSEDVDGDGTPDPGELPWLPLVKITASDSFASQAGSLGEFSIDLPAAAGAGGVNVSYNLDGTALNGTDYELISSSSITVPAGSSTAKIVIKPKTDVLFSGTKTVRLTLTAATGYSSGQIDSTIAIVNIFGNAQPSGVFPYAGHPTISLSVSDDDARENTIVSEATRNGEFTITRTDSSTDPDDLKADLQVRFAVTGTATAGIDYQTIESVIIPANQTSVTVKVIPIDDAIVETAETVILTLLPSPKYELATPNSGTVVIDDKTTAASLITYTVKVVDPIAIESPSSGGYADSAAFEITRTGSILNGKNIDYKIQESGDPGPMQFEFPGGFPGAATLGVDFDPSQGYQGGRNYYPKAISFAAGQWIKKIKITPSTNSRTGDDGVETPETVRLSIIDTITAVTTSGDALIYDHHYDNVPPITIPVAPSLVRLSSSDTKAIESPANAASFQIIRRGAKAGPMYVKFRIDGTVDPSDYQISSANTLTQIAPTVWEGKIAAGNSSTTLTVTPTIDGVAEGVESMIISLVDSGDYQTDTDRQIALRILDSSTTPDIIPDTDRDGINDLDELSATLPTDPLDSDSDGDGIPDGYFANASSDTNEDGISNTAELILRLFATDSDGDGITDFREINRGTDPISGTFSADVTAPTITLTSPTSPKVTALP